MLEVWPSTRSIYLQKVWESSDVYIRSCLKKTESLSRKRSLCWLLLPKHLLNMGAWCTFLDLNSFLGLRSTLILENRSCKVVRPTLLSPHQQHWCPTGIIAWLLTFCSPSSPKKWIVSSTFSVSHILYWVLTTINCTSFATKCLCIHRNEITLGINKYFKCKSCETRDWILSLILWLHTRDVKNSELAPYQFLSVRLNWPGSWSGI